jgi:hypothetical protein
MPMCKTTSARQTGKYVYLVSDAGASLFDCQCSSSDEARTFKVQLVEALYRVLAASSRGFRVSNAIHIFQAIS